MNLQPFSENAKVQSKQVLCLLEMERRKDPSPQNVNINILSSEPFSIVFETNTWYAPSLLPVLICYGLRWVLPGKVFELHTRDLIKINPFLYLEPFFCAKIPLLRTRGLSININTLVPKSDQKNLKKWEAICIHMDNASKL